MKKFLLVLLAIVLYLGYVFYASNNLLQLERITIQKNDLPPSFDGFTVVALSDIHAKVFGDRNQPLFTMVSEQEPDIIVLTGDVAERLTELSIAKDLFAGLMKIAPTYYVTGNHEWGADWAARKKDEKRFTPDFFALLDDYGVIRLDNKAVRLTRNGESLWLCGLCDPNGPGSSKSIPEVLSLAGDEFSILLSHRHDLFDAYVKNGADVVFTGHAHGGVVRLPFSDGLIGPGRDWWPEYTSGLYTKGSTAMVVSRGLGDTTFPRMWNRPHVVAATLKCG